MSKQHKTHLSFDDGGTAIPVCTRHKRIPGDTVAPLTYELARVTCYRCKCACREFPQLANLAAARGRAAAAGPS